ncbi:MAG: AAA family ATPase [Candidatus Pacearchaeota archaeon]|nr:AAA family ATPase [Candidatus Pacearchaeota archaeon]
MKYRYSHVDRRNLEWFLNDATRATLFSIVLQIGKLRGLSPCEMNFQYPLSAIAGKNGSGKSTLLALAACAYHNHSNGFSLPRRKSTYYTMSDFFIQSSEEVAADGIGILYEFFHNNWRRSKLHPNGIGRGWQGRVKNEGGKWSNYSRRVPRNVVFFGIERVVPHSERSVSKSYRHSFKRSNTTGFEKEVIRIVSKILGKRYDDFWFREHSKYKLPHVKYKKAIYSGFNMGAGENALFEILSTVFAAPEGLFIVIDEIELGLHESAQRRFIEELKVLCSKRKIQVICTTHSPAILSTLPPEGRFYIERNGDETIITNGISPEYAAGRLAEQNSKELDVFVEDGIARLLVQSILGINERRRINIIPIGSAAAVIRQLSARYKETNSGECIAFLDGDQKAFLTKHIKYFQSNCEFASEDTSATKWLIDRLQFLPGDSWPEWWIFTTLTDHDLSSLAVSFSITVNELKDIFEIAVNAGKHKEFNTLAEQLSLPENEVCCTICKWIAEVENDSFKFIIDKINLHLD